MLKLKRWNTAPPSGFCFTDKATHFTAHGWSVNSAASLWFHEQHRRGNYVTMDSCKDDVEKYTCEELMKSPGWQEWVMVQQGPPVFSHPVVSIAPESNITVVIPVHELDPSRIKRVLDSIVEQVNEVIVVTDKEPVDPPKRPKVRFVTVPGDQEVGFASKCNLGAKEASSAYVWFLNDDCYPNPNCSAKLMSVLLANQRIGMVGHLLRYPDGRIQHGGTQRAPDRVGFPHLDQGLTETTIKSPTEMEAVTAASILVRKEAFDAVGGFDEEYFLYLEDSDLCLKMRTAGWRVYYTPLTEAIHEESASSSKRPDNSRIIAKSVEIFTRKWGTYFKASPPVFESFEAASSHLKVDVAYVHLVGHEGYESAAKRFVESALRFPPGKDVNWVVLLNSPNGNQLSDQMKEVFAKLGHVTYFKHDNSGWDIGAFQAYCKTSTADIVLFLGGTAYCRRHNWIFNVINAYKAHGDGAIYGVCGNMGDSRVNVSPHIRTTGFWCAPSVLNKYPTVVRSPDQRYPFEHGQHSMTMWAWSQGLQVLVVDAERIYPFPEWDNSTEGYHRGTQKNLIFGDRLTEPPYFSHA